MTPEIRAALAAAVVEAYRQYKAIVEGYDVVLNNPKATVEDKLVAMIADLNKQSKIITGICDSVLALIQEN